MAIYKRVSSMDALASGIKMTVDDDGDVFVASVGTIEMAV